MRWRRCSELLRMCHWGRCWQGRRQEFYLNFSFWSETVLNHENVWCPVSEVIWIVILWCSFSPLSCPNSIQILPNSVSGKLPLPSPALDTVLAGSNSVKAWSLRSNCLWLLMSVHLCILSHLFLIWPPVSRIDNPIRVGTGVFFFIESSLVHQSWWLSWWPLGDDMVIRDKDDVMWMMRLVIELRVIVVISLNRGFFHFYM